MTTQALSGFWDPCSGPYACVSSALYRELLCVTSPRSPPPARPHPSCPCPRPPPWPRPPRPPPILLLLLLLLLLLQAQLLSFRGTFNSRNFQELRNTGSFSAERCLEVDFLLSLLGHCFLLSWDSFCETWESHNTIPWTSCFSVLFLPFPLQLWPCYSN